jgi:Protein of Unknown function (DUF2784)
MIMLQFSANLILVTHALFIAFVILGLVAVMLGGYWRWDWVKNWWFRVTHLLGIGIVVAESWLGLICPLTEWENRLRKAAGETIYSNSFVEHWLHKILFYDFAPWVFTAAYTIFGIVVLIAWVIVPPGHTRNQRL